MKIELFIARRYLFSKKSRNLINYISIISGVIIAFVTMAMVLVLSTFNGIDSLVKNLYSSFEADIEIRPTTGANILYSDSLQNVLLSVDGVEELAPVLEGQVVLQSGKVQLVAKLLGVDQQYLNILPINRLINRGSMDDFFNPSYRNIILGAGLHYHLKRAFQFPVIEPLQVLNIPKTARLSSNSFGNFKSTNFVEVGTFSVTAEFDLNYALIPENYFKEIFALAPKVCNYLVVKSDKNNPLSDLKSKLNNRLGDSFEVKTREEKNALLYQTSQSEKWVSFAIMFFIVIVAAFNIVASLCILVMEKKKDLFVLKTLGLTEAKISTVFFFQSLMINGLGLIIGLSLGALLVYLQNTLGLLRLEGSVVEFYPVKMVFNDILLITCTILGIAVITFWPVQRLVQKISR